jgi:multidrug efflux pump subunit AcrA (membrane-fusion protein)
MGLLNALNKITIKDKINESSTVTKEQLHDSIIMMANSFAEIDEIARGSGKVVPSGQNQIVQHLEGGIVQEILVKEGDFVNKDQVLIRVSNEKSTSTVASNELKS